MLIMNAAQPEVVMGNWQLDVIAELAMKGLFRERDLTQRKISIDWLQNARIMGRVRRHGRGVWGHAHYAPTRYELAQIRLPRLVFWGPSALWLLGAEAQEPDGLWVAIGNKSRPPTSLELSTVIIRTRNLDRAVVSHQPQGRLITLRVHDPSRARADVQRADLPNLLERAVNRARFRMPSEASFLSADLPVRKWEPPIAPRDQWVVQQTITRP
jgi:hypothetical protein